MTGIPGTVAVVAFAQLSNVQLAQMVDAVAAAGDQTGFEDVGHLLREVAGRIRRIELGGSGRDEAGEDRLGRGVGVGESGDDPEGRQADLEIGVRRRGADDERLGKNP